MKTPLTSFQRLPDPRRRTLVKRLNRLTGHLKGVGEMMERGESCDAILLQLTAVKSALNSLSGELLDEHLDCCISDLSGNREALQPFRRAVRQLVKHS